MLTHAGNQVLLYSDPVRREALVPKTGSGNRLKPVSEPRRRGPRLTDPADAPAVAQLLEVPNLLDHDRLRPAHHVPAIHCTVVMKSDAHTTVPVTVTAQID